RTSSPFPPWDSSLSPSARITPSDLSLKFFGIPSVRKTTTSSAGGYHVPGHLQIFDATEKCNRERGGPNSPIKVKG
ncbi:MAG: hypothetical protein WC331_08890, partial [Candidatus Omnitrophota bacterium]